MCVRELLEQQTGPARDQRATKYLILTLIVEFIHGIVLIWKLTGNTVQPSLPLTMLLPMATHIIIP